MKTGKFDDVLSLPDGDVASDIITSMDRANEISQETDDQGRKYLSAYTRRLHCALNVVLSKETDPDIIADTAILLKEAGDIKRKFEKTTGLNFSTQ